MNIVQELDQGTRQTDVEVIRRQALSELQQLVGKRAQLSRRISVLRKTVRALIADEARRNPPVHPLIRLTPRKRHGITHVCRSILQQATRPLAVQEIVDTIRILHPSAIRGNTDILGAVPAVLRYLLESGEANNTFNEEGVRTWFAARCNAGNVT